MGKKDFVTVTMNGEVVPAEMGYRADDGHPDERLPMPEPEGGWPADEFTGMGGSYVRDPFTGVRSRVEPVAE